MMKRHLPLPALILSLIACSTAGKFSVEETDTANTGGNGSDTSNPVDMDGDGWVEEEDCNDQDATVSPGAQEECNGVDDDCNGEIDDGAGEHWYVDADGDAYGGEFLGQSCDPPGGAVSTGGDCADDDPNIHPGSTVLTDGQDSDCDGRKDWNVTIYVAVDDAGELCLNDGIIGPTGGWTTGVVYEVWLHSGTNAVGIYGWDLGRVITAAIAHLEISDGSIWVTDSTWRYDPNPDQQGVAKQGWCGAGFDDSAWDYALDIGPIGDTSNPWGNAPSIFPSGSPAHWIWDHFPVNLNSQYLRMEFDLP